MYTDDEEKRMMYVFIAGWIANGILPAAIAWNANLLLFPVGLIPTFAIVYAISDDYYKFRYLAVASGATLVISVITALNSTSARF